MFGLNRRRELPLCLCMALGALWGCEKNNAPKAASEGQAAAPAEATRQADAEASQAHHQGRAPLKLQVKGPENPQPNSEIEVVVTIERRSARLPVDLSLQLPPGATLIQGAATERIAPDAGPIERRYLVRLGAVPTADLQVTAQAYDQDVGVHGRGVYRFGRPAPHLPEPTRSDRSTVIGNQDFGRPIELKPQSAKP